MKSEIRTKITLSHFKPIHRFRVLTLSLCFEQAKNQRRIPKIPKIIPAQKSTNPGPGFLRVPIPSGTDIAQMKIESANQKRPVNRPRKFNILSKTLSFQSDEQNFEWGCLASPWRVYLSTYSPNSFRRGTLTSSAFFMASLINSGPSDLNSSPILSKPFL